MRNVGRAATLISCLPFLLHPQLDSVVAHACNSPKQFDRNSGNEKFFCPKCCKSAKFSEKHAVKNEFYRRCFSCNHILKDKSLGNGSPKKFRHHRNSVLSGLLCLYCSGRKCSCSAEKIQPNNKHKNVSNQRSTNDRTELKLKTSSPIWNNELKHNTTDRKKLVVTFNENKSEEDSQGPDPSTKTSIKYNDDSSTKNINRKDAPSRTSISSNNSIFLKNLIESQNSVGSENNSTTRFMDDGIEVSSKNFENDFKAQIQPFSRSSIKSTHSTRSTDKKSETGRTLSISSCSSTVSTCSIEQAGLSRTFDRSSISRSSEGSFGRFSANSLESLDDLSEDSDKDPLSTLTQHVRKYTIMQVTVDPPPVDMQKLQQIEMSTKALSERLEELQKVKEESEFRQKSSSFVEFCNAAQNIFRGIVIPHAIDLSRDDVARRAIITLLYEAKLDHLGRLVALFKDISTRDNLIKGAGQLEDSSNSESNSTSLQDPKLSEKAKVPLEKMQEYLQHRKADTQATEAIKCIKNTNCSLKHYKTFYNTVTMYYDLVAYVCFGRPPNPAMEHNNDESINEARQERAHYLKKSKLIAIKKLLENPRLLREVSENEKKSPVYTMLAEQYSSDALSFIYNVYKRVLRDRLTKEERDELTKKVDKSLMLCDFNPRTDINLLNRLSEKMKLDEELVIEALFPLEARD